MGLRGVLVAAFLAGAVSCGDTGPTTLAEPGPVVTVTTTVTATVTRQARQARRPRSAPPRARPTPTPTPRARATAPATDPRFGTCREANAHGYGDYRRGVDPEYGWYQDRDADGVVCEF